MLKIKGLTKYFSRGTPNEVLAIDDLDLSVLSGQFICVIGSNGAGKSTLLSCIAGTSLPEAGTILLKGVDITHLPEYKRAKQIGRVFQDPLSGTCPSMTIVENMSLAMRRGKSRTLRMGINRRERDFYRENLHLLGLGLEKRLDDKVGLLSGGQRQSLSLLMAALVRPTILLLDEHTAALDPKTAELVIRLTQDLVLKDNLTTIMITHNMTLALNNGNRLIMMHQGKILLDFDEKTKNALTVPDLLEHFEVAHPLSPVQVSDRMLLS
ncbi:MAG: ATP-binding cassette domain-containing protein [Deltaproteobacteria bacterium]|jgi:putative ABC transport system ATP-binding protein|nr:ATP-binding cassette domain-containing protein [Deltaproteobacteria bacterium]